MNECITDNRFEIIARAKQALLDSTNIDTSPDEMACLDSFLFRCWQMGWLDKYEKDLVEVVRKPVKGYEGHYEVDQFGRVYSVNRVIHIIDNSREYDKPIAGRQLRQSLHTKGYKVVALTLDGVTKTQFVHRLVAEAFIENPDNLPMVNHKDEDKTNNFVDNLEWCTAEYNTNYGNARKKQAKKLKGRPHTEEHKKKISESLKAYFCSYGERKEK